jgi:hypothetical protein
VICDTVNSTTLIPQIHALIRIKGEGSKIDDGSFKVSTTWVNDLCRKLGLSMRSKTQESYKEPDDWKDQMEKFRYQMAYVVRTRDLSKEDVYNIDQTGCPLTARSKQTRAIMGSKDVIVSKKPGKNEKLVVTPNMTHKLQPLDVSINSALKAKTKAVFSIERGKKIAKLIEEHEGNATLVEKIVQIEHARKPKVKRQDAIDCSYKAWEQIETSLVLKAWQDSLILDAWDCEVQDKALKMFENGALFPLEPGSGKFTIFPDVETCDAPIQVLETKDTTSEDEEEYSVHDSDDESQSEEPSEGDNVYDPSSQPRGRRPGTRSRTKS